jgi:hypothetical protein
MRDNLGENYGEKMAFFFRLFDQHEPADAVGEEVDAVDGECVAAGGFAAELLW